MAEFALPILALGSLYIACNKDDEKKEGYINRNPANILPNTNTPVINYPVAEPVNKEDNLNAYSDANQATDKYYNQEILTRKIATETPKLPRNNVSLTGEAIAIDKFKHNNMVPFFGAKLHGNAFMKEQPAESLLDNLQGAGSQHQRKIEQAPLFKPQASLQYSHGAPNHSDFIQSRMNPSMKINNVTPFESNQNVGPGLNQGYSTCGTGGYNSGMEARNSWLPKTVNELRVDTNPKITFGLAGHQGPAGAGEGRFNAPSSQTQGRVQKYLPDSFYINTPDRYFTTTGLEKAQTARPLENIRFVNRATTNMAYGGDAGPAAGGSVCPAPENYRAPHVKQLPSKPLTNAQGDVRRHMQQASPEENMVVTNRMVTGDRDYLGIAGGPGLMGAVIAPIMDLLRPSRKENVIGNLRPFGNANQINGVSEPRVWNPADRAPTTTKETTQYSPFESGARAYESEHARGYANNSNRAVYNQRDTTSVMNLGCAGSTPGTANSRTYDAEYNATTTSCRSQKDQTPQGNMCLLNGNVNQSTHRLDSDRETTGWAPASVPRGAGSVPSMETFGKIHMPQSYDNNFGCDRINPDILQAFKQNPYTQSLASYA